MKVPSVRVLMSIYNGMLFVGQAVEITLKQSCADFGFIMVDSRLMDAKWETQTAYAPIKTSASSCYADGRIGASTEPSAEFSFPSKSCVAHACLGYGAFSITRSILQ